jgi:hypothetical protein
MSIVGIFSRSQPNIGGFIFDAILQESTELVTQITEFPIDTGAVGNDHAVQKPLKIIMTVGISDNSFRAIAAKAGGFSSLAGVGIGLVGGSVINRLGQSAAAAGLLASVVNANAAFDAGQAGTRSQSALEAIRELQRSNAIIDVVSLKQTYKECMITSTRQETTKENEQGLELIVEMKQMLIINSREDKIEIPAPDDTATTQAQPIINLGQVVGQ